MTFKNSFKIFIISALVMTETFSGVLFKTLSAYADCTTQSDADRDFDFGEVSGSVFANTWANMSIDIPHGFTTQTGKDLYEAIYYEPDDAVFDGLQATDLLMVCPEYMDAYMGDRVHELEDSLIFTLLYMPDTKSDGTKIDDSLTGPALAMAAVGAKGYEAYVEQGTKVIGGYSYNSYTFDLGNSAKAKYRAENPGKDSPLFEEDIRVKAEVDIRSASGIKIILLTLTTGEYYGKESLITGGIRNIRGTYNG